MKVYQISYDLRKQRNYDALYERIKNLGGWCHALESSWVVASQYSAAQIHDDLKKALHHDDGLLVTHLQGEAAWSGLGNEISRWLKEQLNICTV